MKRAAAVAAALLACSIAGCASPYRDFIEHEGWLEIQTRNFAVLGNVEHDELRALARDLQIYDALVEKVLNAPAGDDPPPVRLFVFRSEDDADLFTKWAAGIMMPTPSGYYAVQNAAGPGFRFRNRGVLFHEYTHAVLERNRRVPYPRWYDEGLSEFMGSAQLQRGLVLVGGAPAGRLASLSYSGLMPLESLFDNDLTARREVLRFYASSWAVVHYLNTVGRAGGRLPAFVGRMARGEDWRAAYDAVFDEPLEELQGAIEAHVQRVLAGARFDFALRIDSLPIEGEPSERAVSGAEIAYELGNLQREMGLWYPDWADFDDARKLFQQALALDPDHARARAAEGWCEAKRFRWADGAAQIALAREQSPDDAVVLLDAGRFHVLRADERNDAAERQAARELLERASALAPEDPDVHAELGRVFASLGDGERAIEALTRARELGEWSPALDLELARQLVQAGESAKAEKLLVLVAAHAHGGETSEQARELLESIRSGGATD